MERRKENKVIPLPTLQSKKRLLFLMTTVLVLFFGLAVKMAVVVFIQGGELQNKAMLQQTRDLTVAAQRGEFLDCNGNVLAQSATAQTVVLRPSEITKSNTDAIVSVLAKVLEMDEKTVREKATDTKKSEVWLKRQVTTDVANTLRAENLPGVYFSVDVRRYYPNSSFLTQTLGYTSVDGAGQEGLEAYFEKYLAGQDGKIISEADNTGKDIAIGEEQYIAPVDGYNVVLSIDEVIQSFVEQAVQEAYVEQNAKNVYAVAMDPKTGALLALANYPDFDLNDVPRDDVPTLNELTRNKIITDAYEPGSTFKVVTLASALDSGAVSTSDSFFCPGYYVVDGQMIKCWRYPNSHGSQTLEKVVQNSCNVGFMQMGLRMGTETFYGYIKNFGFGQETGIAFPSDGTGIVMAEKYVTNGDLARIAFGQSIAVTPLQLISSFSAVVNGGFLYQPLLVRGITDDDGNYIEKYDPTVVRQVISEQTSATVRGILETVVTEGSGKNCYIPGYHVGGKTGTAQKYDENHNVVHDKVVASFIAFAPVDDPQIAILFIVDEPSVPVTFGSIVAAPYVKSILENALPYLGVQPDYNEVPQPEQVQVPDVTNLDEGAASAALAAMGLDYLTDGTGLVTGQLPAAGATVDKGTTVLLYMETKSSGFDDMEGMTVVPDVSGKDIMEAGQMMDDAGLTMVPSGTGTASYQSIAGGTVVPRDTQVQVEFRDSGG
jgi:stage V sporulation protein D (sporulation-specific penicillin-binding protein)